MSRIVFLLLSLIVFLSSEALDLSGRRLVWVRHGSTDWNWRMMGGGVRDLPINKEGEEYVGFVARAIVKAGIEPEFISSSPLLRCINTAEIIQKEYSEGKGKVLPIIVNKGLSGPDFGHWQVESDSQISLIIKEIEKLGLSDADSKKILVDRMRSIPISGQEDLQDFRKRIYGAVVDIAAQTRGDVVLIGHGSSCEEFLNFLGKRDEVSQTYWSKFNRPPLVVSGEKLNVSLIEELNDKAD